MKPLNTEATKEYIKTLIAGEIQQAKQQELSIEITPELKKEAEIYWRKKLGGKVWEYTFKKTEKIREYIERMNFPEPFIE